jgi:4-hydroxybenzoate polyprenyltransferase
MEYIGYSILRYRIHISLIFFFILLNSWHKLGVVQPNFFVIISYTIWHWALYLFDRAYDAELDIISQGNEAVPIYQKKNLIIFCIVLSVLPFLILYINNENLLPYILFFPFTFLYTFRIQFIGNKRVKDFFILKNLYSAILIWTLPFCLILKIYAGAEQSISYIFINYFFSLFWNTFAGEILWDIRDKKADRINSVNTLPVKLGVFKTKVILFLFWFSSVIFFSNYLQISSFFFLLVLFLSNRKKSPNWIYHILPIISIFDFFLNLYRK